MLELPRLRLRPHRQSASPVRHLLTGLGPIDIVDAISGSPVGEANPTRRTPGWLAWLLSTTVRICEDEDRSLVFTLKRSWQLSPEWVVHDAEQRLIGTITRAARFALYLSDRSRQQVSGSTRIDDAQGRYFSHWDEASSTFMGPGGIEFAAVTRHDGEVELAYIEPEMNPFERMLLLAAALVIG